jgi:hypothetical protein
MRALTSEYVGISITVSYKIFVLLLRPCLAHRIIELEDERDWWKHLANEAQVGQELF